MPTYVYACDACGTQFEQFQSFKEEPLRTCRCGKEGQVRRVFQPVGVVFKGSGWYITDSRKSDSASIGDDTSKSSKPETPAAAPAAPVASESKSDSASTSSD
jgi:putative FmdB family regulatory protein